MKVRWKRFKIEDIKEIFLVKSGGGGGISSASSDTAGHHYIKHGIETKLNNDKIYRLTFIRYSYYLGTVKKHYNEFWPFTLALAKSLCCPASYSGNE